MTGPEPMEAVAMVDRVARGVSSGLTGRLVASGLVAAIGLMVVNGRPVAIVMIGRRIVRVL